VPRRLAVLPRDLKIGRDVGRTAPPPFRADDVRRGAVSGSVAA
jgi:hypothetical protein